MIDLPVGSTLFFDIESYPNYFLASFKDEAGKQYHFEWIPNWCTCDTDELLRVLLSYRLIGYNSRGFDVPLILVAIKYGPEKVYACGQKIINENLKWYQLESEFEVTIPEINHIDLIEVVPLTGSLKMRGAQMHCRTIQDLPFNPGNELTPEQMGVVREYCGNDLAVTEMLFNELSEEMALREKLSAQYGVDVRSKSDAQIAEAVIGNRLRQIKGSYPKKPGKTPDSVKYDAPPWMHFSTPQLQETLQRIQSTDFEIADSGAVEAPAWLKSHSIVIAGASYKMGIGGLHSQEEKVFYRSSDTHFIVDRDVASYYPAIIMNQRLYPPHLGEEFLTVYGGILDERLAAKKAGNKTVANSLKIVVNGSFGKLASKYSILYAPKLFLQVTITGQLALLMLIEKAAELGIKVISANTDGVVFYCPQVASGTLDWLISAWERITNFTTEETRYSAYYARDVNNYVAVKPDGKTKSKGAFTNPWADGKSTFRFHKNPTAQICTEALTLFLANRTPIAATISACGDVSKFAVVRTVKGGGEKDGEPLGKVVRWYWSTSSPGPIRYCSNGNAVADSDNGRPMMTLPNELPHDIDFAYYIKRTNDMLHDVGYFYRKQITFW